MSDEQPADEAGTGRDPRHPDWAHSFGGVAEAYERGRPTYPAEAVRWMLGEQPLTVLELGAGTGKLTRVIAQLGHDVHATDPDPAMLQILEREVPGVRTAEASAEDIPLADASVDVVISNCVINLAGDKAKVIAETARVLKPGGRFAVSDVIADEGMDEATRADMAAYTGCIAGALTEAEFRSALADAGLTDVEIRPTHRVHDQATSAIIRARKPGA